MTAQDRCTDTAPHRPHRAQYGPFGVKDCPGVPLQHLLAEPTNTEETPADAARRLAGELEQLRYERKLLGAARTVLDQIADAATRITPSLISQAADMAQRIVDEIGHPATDEPALGPSHREQLDRLGTGLAVRGIDVDYLLDPAATVDAALTAIDELRAHPEWAWNCQGLTAGVMPRPDSIPCRHYAGSEERARKMRDNALGVGVIERRWVGPWEEVTEASPCPTDEAERLASSETCQHGLLRIGCDDCARPAAAYIEGTEQA